MSVLSIAAYVMSGLLIVIVNKCTKTQSQGSSFELGAGKLATSIVQSPGGSGDFITSAII